MKPVYCEYKLRNGEPCPCGNKEIPSNEVQRRRLFGIDAYPIPYCILALAIIREDEAAFNKKYQYTKRRSIKKDV